MDNYPMWRGCPFVPFSELTPRCKEQAKQRFSPTGRRGEWRSISSWAFAVTKRGNLATTSWIEPSVGTS
jgi:hypothetical protein